MAKKPKFQPFPVALYSVLGIFTLLLVGRGLGGKIVEGMNPDSRTALEMARDVCDYQHRQNAKAVGECTDKKVQYFADEATCQMQLMGFWKGDPPATPEPPKKPPGNNPFELLKYKRRVKQFPNVLKAHPYRVKLWEENNKTRSEYVMVPDASGVRGKKHLWMPNLHSFVHEDRIKLATGMVKQLKVHKDFKKSVEWLPPGEELLKEPLACVRRYDGTCAKTWEGTTSKKDAANGRDCLFLKPIADAFSRANRRMHDDGKGEIMFKVCYRNNLHQAILFVTIAGEGCSLTGARPGITMPGGSHHGLGMAADVLNHGQAEEYLFEEGIACGFIKDDEGHCSIAEENLQAIGAKWRVFKNKFKNWRRDAKDAWKNRHLLKR